MNTRLNKLLVEAVRGYLHDDSALGLGSHEDKEENSHTMWFQWENIDDEFAMKVAGSAFYESMTSAFYAVHSYKYLNDPTFGQSLLSELKSRAVPAQEMQMAFKSIEEIIKENGGEMPKYIRDYGNAIAEMDSANNSRPQPWQERDAGWNPQIGDITNMTRNADEWEGKSEPFTGGGPAPKDDELGDYSAAK